MNMNVIPGQKKVATLCVLQNEDKFLLLKRLKEPNKNNYTPHEILRHSHGKFSDRI